jgi:hypothetical protein
MIFSINNYLVNSLKKNDVNFEPIKQYGVPVAILYMPPPIPIGVDMKFLAETGSKIKNKKSATDSDERELKGGGDNEYMDENKFNYMFDKISIKRSSNKTRKKNK